jgi:hypothetical protein
MLLAITIRNTKESIETVEELRQDNVTAYNRGLFSESSPLTAHLQREQIVLFLTCWLKIVNLFPFEHLQKILAANKVRHSSGKEDCC